MGEQRAFQPRRGASDQWAGDGLLKFWDPTTGALVRTLDCTGRSGSGSRAGSTSVTRVEFSPDGMLLVSSSTDKKVRVWKAATGELLKVLKVRTDRSWEWASAATFSPDGTLLAASWTDGALRVWKVGTWRRQWRRSTLRDLRAVIRSTEGKLRGVNGTAFSPDGTQLASGADDTTSMIWDPSTGRRLQTLEGHLGRVTDLSYRPDGRLLATSSNDGQARIWDPATGEHLRSAGGPVNWNFMLGLAFSPDGTRLATASHDQAVRIWDAAAW